MVIRPVPSRPSPVTSPARASTPAPGTPAVLPPTPPAPPAVPEVSAAASRRVEAMLRRAGFNPGRVDGDYTARSAAALREFQSSVGLPSTGAPDTRTLNALKAVNRRVARHGTDLLAMGQKNGAVKIHERRLQKLGYDVGRVDGVFDRNTARAVKAFKADQAELKSTSGVLGKLSQDSLRAETRAMAHDVQRTRVKPTDARRKADVAVARDAATVDADGSTGIGRGDRGANVKVVQQHLRAAGYDPKNTRGVFDERTEGALKQFQSRSGLPQSGRVDAATWRALQKSTMEASSGTSPSQRVNERSGAVKATESMLRDMGLKTGKVDGLYTDSTQRAVDAFRRRHKLGGAGQGVGPNLLKRMRTEWKASRGVSLQQLVKTMPGLATSRARQLLDPLNRAMREFGINTEKRKEAFLAQLGHESGSLRYFEEIASGAAYEGRTDLGNVRPGDGVRYKGRGPIQLTGRSNYRSAGAALGLPLEQKPWLASRPSVGFRIAGWFWKTRGLNAMADAGDFHGITRRINGGTNGLSDRLYRWSIAKRVIH